MQIPIIDRELCKAVLDVLARMTPPPIDPERRSAAPDPGLAAIRRVLTTLQRLGDANHERLAASIRTIRISIDEEDFNWAVQSLSRSERAQQVLRELILRDAPYQMIESLFRIGYRGYRRLRAELEMSSRPSGRPRLPPWDQQLEIIRTHRVLAAQYPVPESYLRLHDRFPRFHIGSLHRAVVEVVLEEPPSPSDQTKSEQPIASTAARESR